jgi:hypothetical protein
MTEELSFKNICNGKEISPVVFRRLAIIIAVEGSANGMAFRGNVFCEMPTNALINQFIASFGLTYTEMVCVESNCLRATDARISAMLIENKTLSIPVGV